MMNSLNVMCSFSFQGFFQIRHELSGNHDFLAGRTNSYVNNLSFCDGDSIIRLCQIGKDFASKMQNIEARCV